MNEFWKGNSKEGNKEVQGYLYRIWEDAYILWSMTNGVPNMIPVKPETLRPAVDIKDEHGVELYKGDIIFVTDLTMREFFGDNLPQGIPYRRKYEIIWQDMSWKIKYADDTDEYSELFSNIVHDFPLNNVILEKVGSVYK